MIIRRSGRRISNRPARRRAANHGIAAVAKPRRILRKFRQTGIKWYMQTHVTILTISYVVRYVRKRNGASMYLETERNRILVRFADRILNLQMAWNILCGGTEILTPCLESVRLRKRKSLFPEYITENRLRTSITMLFVNAQI